MLRRSRKKSAVVPYVGTWIEITAVTTLFFWASRRSLRGNVDRNIPYVGTWIEIRKGSTLMITAWVVPYVGTWIEIYRGKYLHAKCYSRSLRGNVDRNSLKGVKT